MGTFQSAGRHSLANALGFYLGLLVGAGCLGFVLAALRTVIPLLPADRQYVAWAAAGALLLVVDILASPRLSANMRVPAQWVKGRRSASVVWGIALGMAFLTEAPYIVLHFALIGAILLPYPGLAAAAPLAFAAGRGVVTTAPWMRSAVLSGMECRVGTDLGRPLSIAAASVTSRVCVLLTTAVLTVAVLT
jgi:hypothetical protein